MSKFWAFSGVLIVIGLIAVIGGSTAQEIFFTDIETECRLDKNESVDLAVTNDNELYLNGHFPVQSTSADILYDYNRRGDRIVLDVYAENDREPETFQDTCYASGVYEATTIEYEGEYTVIVKHNGEEFERKVVNFN